MRPKHLQLMSMQILGMDTVAVCNTSSRDRIKVNDRDLRESKEGTMGIWRPKETDSHLGAAFLLRFTVTDRSASSGNCKLCACASSSIQPFLEFLGQ